MNSELEALIDPQMRLAFAGHEDGGRLEPFSWCGAEQGEFSSFSLIQSEGWCSQMEVAAVLSAWQQPEQVGAVGGLDWLLPEGDPAEIWLSAATQATHRALDAELLDLLQSRLQNLEALKLSCASEACDSDYALPLLLGQIEETWLGIAPSVPVATDLESSPLRVTPLPMGSPDSASMLQLQIQDLLTRRGSVKIYGYYGGGYHQTHNYHLVQAAGSTQAAAVEALMQATGLLRRGQFEAFQPSSAADKAQLEPLAQRLRLLQAQVYQFSFWDWEQAYILGEALETAADRTGVVLRSRFTYNP
ncbi:MAG: hypothetical protein KME07_00300 [Pegethrix bostrychoides GSE-TBD4-15B]|jgi:hypothetical protein|uniref:Uncharacterized protein n=1 Tax=Pegethrix bostrychoides GSE-TBD4-15B TaxID=2839662 RepID=A0A951P6H6_9CYAN|nr:hypothetical protein [Pegethrix bostrychoides GSE-TBD4-15B]